MENLKRISEVVYLKMSFEEMERRIGNVVDRGVALKPGTTLRDLYEERIPYYERYADIVIDEAGKTPGDMVDELRNIIERMMDKKSIRAIMEEQKKTAGGKGQKACGLRGGDSQAQEKDWDCGTVKGRFRSLFLMVRLEVHVAKVSTLVC